MAKLLSAPSISRALPRVQGRLQALGGPAGAVTVFVYRTAEGALGSTTDASTIPPGAEIERRTG